MAGISLQYLVGGQWTLWTLNISINLHQFLPNHIVMDLGPHSSNKKLAGLKLKKHESLHLLLVWWWILQHQGRTAIKIVGFRSVSQRANGFDSAMIQLCNQISHSSQSYFQNSRKLNILILGYLGCFAYWHIVPLHITVALHRVLIDDRILMFSILPPEALQRRGLSHRAWEDKFLTWCIWDLQSSTIFTYS